MQLVDAYMAWGLVGTQERIERDLDLPLGRRMPMWNGVCVNFGAYQSPDLDQQRALLTFITIVVRDRLDPQVVHEAFLAIDEYRARISPDTPGAD